MPGLSAAVSPAFPLCDPVLAQVMTGKVVTRLGVVKDSRMSETSGY